MRKEKGARGLPLLLLPIGMSLGLLAVVFIRAGLFPFGKETLVWGDFSSQVVPFLSQLGLALRGEAGLLYSMQNASGMSFVGVLLYFLASPFSLLAALVPGSHMNELANLLVVLKIVCAACTATLLFGSRRFPFNPGKAAAGLLGVMYAFGGYTFFYYQNNVWLDAMYLLPLLALALLALAQDGKLLPFSFALAAMVVCQFQLAFMVAIALVLLTGLYVAFFAPPHTGGVLAARLAVGAGIAALLSAAAWLPALVQYNASARSMDWKGFIAWGKLRTDYYTTTPVVLCTAAVFAALAWLLYKRCWRMKPVRFCLLAFGLLCVPLLVEPINVMWHGGGYQSFPSRYGFITLLAGLVLVAAALWLLNQLPSPKISGIGGTLVFSVGVGLYLVLLLYILLAHKNEAGVYVWTLWADKGSLKWALISAGGGAVLLFVVLLLRGRLQVTRQLVVGALACVLALQGLYNGVLYIGGAAGGTGYYKAFMDLEGHLSTEARVKTSMMYRPANDVGAAGYASIAHYSSFTRQDALSAYKKLGYSGYWMELSGFGGTGVSDYFLNIGGVITRDDEVDNLYDADAVVYQNEFFALQTLPAGGYATLTNADAALLAGLPEGDRYNAQNWLYRTLYGGEGDILRRYEPTWLQGVDYELYNDIDRYGVWLQNDDVFGEVWYEIEVGERETLYFDCFRYISNNLDEVVNDALGVTVNGVSLEPSYPNYGANGILNLGTFENETVEIRISVWRSCLSRSFGVAGLRESDLAAMRQSAENPAVQQNGSGFTVQASAGAGQLLVLSLGYDEGFTATVNGKAATVHQVLDGYTAIELEAGQNTVVLRYFPVGLKAGLVASGLGILACVLVLLRRRKKAAGAPLANGQVRACSVLRVALMALAAGVFIAVYVVPVLAWLYLAPHP